MLREPGPQSVTVLTSRLPETAVACESGGPRYQVVRYPALELIPNFPVPKVWTSSFWRALRTASPRRHDVIVSHTRFFVSSLLALVCARIAGRRLLHVEHGSDYVQLGSHVTRLLARAYDFFIGRIVLHSADAVVAVSDAAAEFVQRLAGRQSQVIYRGVWSDRLTAVSPDPDMLRNANGRAVVSFVGRLIDGKGVADLLRAFAAMDSEAAVLYVVGDGPRRGDLERLAQRLALTGRVVFRGYLNEAQALSAILASDVVVNPSYTEGLPTSVLEAAVLGRAVLATDVGGTAEIITDGYSGVLVAPRDVDSLAKELRRLIHQPELRQRLASAARSETAQRFSWETGARQFLDVARSLVNEGPAHPG